MKALIFLVADGEIELTEKVSKELRLSMKLDSDKDGVQKDENYDEPVEDLRLDNVTNSEPTLSERPYDANHYVHRAPQSSTRHTYVQSTSV